METTTKTETVTRFVGCCQICEGEFKLTAGDNRMVHHGYKRPGDGYIVGDCMAVGEPAYEQSCEILKVYAANLQERLASKKERLADLQSGSVKKLTKIARERIGFRLYKDVLVEVSEGEADFPRVLEGKIDSEKNDIFYLEREVARCEKRIANWVALPVRTVEEKAREEQANRDARKAEKDAARAKKAAEAKAREEKANALKAKRQAIVDGFKAQFVALANGVESEKDRQNAAVEVARKCALKKHSFFDARDLGCDEELVKLGLATAETYNGRTFYRYSVFFG